MGCPRGITDKKYDRNTLIFNFGFVFDKDCDTVPFESLVRKLGATFRIYEVCVVHGWRGDKMLMWCYHAYQIASYNHFCCNQNEKHFLHIYQITSIYSEMCHTHRLYKLVILFWCCPVSSMGACEFTIHHLQLENGFLSDNIRRSKLPEILAQMFNELNHHGMCSIPIGNQQE